MYVCGCVCLCGEHKMLVHLKHFPIFCLYQNHIELPSICSIYSLHSFYTRICYDFYRILINIECIGIRRVGFFSLFWSMYTGIFSFARLPISRNLPHNTQAVRRISRVKLHNINAYPSGHIFILSLIAFRLFSLFEGLLCCFAL